MAFVDGEAEAVAASFVDSPDVSPAFDEHLNDICVTVPRRQQQRRVLQVQYSHFASYWPDP